jgi:hypothetical protein
MSNKNSIFVFIIISIFFSLAKVFFIKDFKVPREKLFLSNSEMAISPDDLIKVESRLKLTQAQRGQWKNIIDPKLNFENILTLQNSQDYFELVNTIVPDLVLCLRKDNCGIIKNNTNGPSFDTDSTLAHLLLAKNIIILHKTLKLRPELVTHVDWNLMTEISGLNGNEIKAASLSLLTEFDKRNNGKDRLFEIAKTYRGSEKADFFALISADLVLEERPIFIQTLEKSFNEDEPSTVIKIVQNMKKFHLSKVEVADLGRALCNSKLKAANDSNWKSIMTSMKNIDSSFEQNCI